MPGHFAHIYTARRVADLLADPRTTSFDVAGSALESVADGLTPQDCGEIMQRWERFTALGGVGPDLFFFSQDYSAGPLAAGPFQDDILMLAMTAYYWADAAKEDDYEPLLLLAEVTGTFAEIARMLIQLKRARAEFVAVYNLTVKKFVDEVVTVLDDLTGGLIEEFATAMTNLANAILQVEEMELLTYGDIFSWFSLKMRQGWAEQGFLWSDLLHYRRTSQMAVNLLAVAKRQRREGGSQEQFDQFLGAA